MPRAKKPSFNSDFSKGLKNDAEMDLEEDEMNNESPGSSPRNQSKLEFLLT